MKAAAEAFPRWSALPVTERAIWIHRLADEIERRKPIIGQIEALDAGKIPSQAEGDVQNCVDTMRYFNQMAQYTQRRNALAVSGHEAWTMRQPWGPCGFIFPWNFPFLLIGWGISPALAAGNTVVIKPAEDTPLSAIYLAQLAREIGFPDGVINVVTGLWRNRRRRARRASRPAAHVVYRLARSGPTGRRSVRPQPRAVQARAGRQGRGRGLRGRRRRRYGGEARRGDHVPHRPGLLRRDALARAREDLRPVRRRVRAAAARRQRRLSDGRRHQMGPVVNAKQRERVLGYLSRGKAEGAKVILEGGAANVPGRAGYYVKPALMEGSLDNVAAREEIFGPVAYLAPFRDETQAIQMANATDYGLANSVWSTDLAARVTRRRVDGRGQQLDQRAQRVPARRAVRRRQSQRPGRRREQRRDAVRLLAQPVDGASAVTISLLAYAFNSKTTASMPGSSSPPISRRTSARARCATRARGTRRARLWRRSAVS